MFGPLVLHSVSYSGSWGQDSLAFDDFLVKARELGFDGVMLAAKRPHVSPLDYDAERRKRLRERLLELNLTTVVLAGYNNFTADLDHTEVPTREIQIAYVIELARLAEDIGAGIVRVFTGYEHPASSYLAQWNMLVAALKECARRAAGHGVIVGVQNHHDLGAGYESMHDLIEAVGEPNCKPLFDAWSPALHGDDLRKAARRLGAITPHTTIADYQLRPRYKYQPTLVNYTKEAAYVQAVPMGEGFIDYRGFLTGLLESGFKGSIAYEMCSPLLHGGSIGVLDRYARGFVEYIRNFQAIS
jgi:sugar phosphate isomerase/epimerase